MARRLLGAGLSLAVYNRDRTKAAPLAAMGARVAESPRDAATGAEVIISMVADDVASRATWIGSDGALASVGRGGILVECSTLTIGWVKELAAAAAERGAELVDAPVTGSKAAAAAGELNFLIGGTEAAVERIGPVLQPMSRSRVHLGPSGSGALVKLVNNFVCGVQIVALAEAIAWIERTALDRDRALRVLLDGAPGSPIVKVIHERIRAEDYTPNFLLRLMEKDLGYATAEAHARGLTLETAAAALGAFRRATAAGHGDKDMAAVVEPLREGQRSPSAR
jgi:3-hydroxyisobutyrate dehydrogenase